MSSNIELISVIMSVKNSNDELNSAIESILAQTYSNFEFIICDDGSEDNTLEKLQDWSKKDSRISIIQNNKNKGLAYSLNRCISMSKGTFIARMDSDDFSYPERFEKQLKFLILNKKFSFCSSNIDIFNGEEITLYNRMGILHPQKKDLVKQSCFVHPATMFRKEMLLKLNGYRVAKETTRAEDYDLFMRAYGMGYEGANILEPLLRYKLSESDIKKKRKFKHRIEEIVVRYKGYKKMNIPLLKYYWIFKPILAGLIPAKIMYSYQNRKIGQS
ncbi:glycosyltransferase family 2 protein [Enterococcus asini]|uniref:glycosyltransferase family 2 protein n=1 Tax=Enterococcus asini TaxID=57732 RepID=UPI001E6345DF|nr:glycosyltransferase family 2 protein [Enterococcus asini]MCD5030040.1 glycosyltransferase family 2 protein [Enterococcus asini]